MTARLYCHDCRLALVDCLCNRHVPEITIPYGEITFRVDAPFPADEDAYKQFLRSKTRGNPDIDEVIETRGPVCPECGGVVWHKLDIFAPAVCMYCGHIHGNEVGGHPV